MRCHLQADTTFGSLRSVRKVARCLVETHGAPEDVAAAIEVAVGEALANAHVHAYPGRAGPVEVTMDVEQAEFSCAIRNPGRAMTSTVNIPNGPPRGPRGRGIYLMSRLMDNVVLGHPDDAGRGTLVRMRKALLPS